MGCMGLGPACGVAFRWISGEAGISQGNHRTTNQKRSYGSTFFFLKLLCFLLESPLFFLKSSSYPVI
jgi:hypothetical protein